MGSLRASRVSVVKARLGEEDDRADRAFGARFTPEARVLEAWRLSLELWIVFQIGVPPRRIDILTSLTGITFAEAC